MSEFAVKLLINEKDTRTYTVEADEFPEAVLKVAEDIKRSDQTVKMLSITADDGFGVRTVSGNGLKDLFLSTDDIAFAYDRGIISITDNPPSSSGCQGIVCNISDGYFYFDDNADKYKNLEEYEKATDRNAIVSKIDTAMKSLALNFPSEYVGYRIFVQDAISDIRLHQRIEEAQKKGIPLDEIRDS